MSSNPAARLYRRLFALVYDGLLLLAVLMLASALPLLFTGGEAVTGHNLLLSMYFTAVTLLFFGWFWTHGGQTLGMRAWRIRLVQADGQGMDWPHVVLRFAVGLPAWVVLLLGVLVYLKPPLGGVFELLYTLPSWSLLLAGSLWLVVDHWPDSWRDRYSDTRVILVEPVKRSAQAAQQQAADNNDQQGGQGG